MIVNERVVHRKIAAQLSIVEIEMIKVYIQGAVHSHCNTGPDKPLSVRTLFGEDNNDWTNTPLQNVYNYHKYISSSNNPKKQAAIDIGWIFKQVLDNDIRKFECVGKDTGKIYKLII